MTQEELKAIENLTNEVKELNRTLTVLAAVQYAEARSVGADPPSWAYATRLMKDGLSVFNEIKQESLV